MRVGDRVRFIHRNTPNQFTNGNIYVIRYVDEGTVGVVQDDQGMPNGWLREYFELIDNEEGPEGIVEWMDLTSFVIFYVEDEVIERGIEALDVCTASYSLQESAEEEVQFLIRSGYKVLATKKLTTRILRP